MLGRGELHGSLIDDRALIIRKAQELDTLLREQYNYHSKIVELDNQDRRPQLQLDKAITDFVFENDGPHRSHLLLVYYTGHGFSKTLANGQEELIVSG